MNRYFFIPLFFSFFISACAQDSNFSNLSSMEFEQLISKKNGTLLDVRTTSEFSNGHIKDAGQLNYYALDFKRKLLLLAKDQPIYLYCNTGYRSKRAAEILVEEGYTQVYNLEHGIMEWNLENLPVIIEKDARPDTKNKMEPDEFYALIQSDKPVFIDFYAPWCAPCRKMMPMIDSLKAEFKAQITIVKINVDASKKLVKELKLGSVPYFVFYQSKTKKFEHYGLIGREELVSLFESLSNIK
ncbi:MAG: thioredoxin domain-containing protein [Bacteroidales bacterium]|nr:thioredoxin domain-containing protein [Bacteroidales bacterium]